MQTFLPYPSYILSARILDRKRLGKQIEEAYHIYLIITGRRKNSRWRHHPAVKMWRPYPYALSLYFNAIREEWLGRGYKTKRKAIRHPLQTIGITFSMPPWLFEPADLFCGKHRQALLKKNKKYYSKFKWTDKPKIDYWWPNVPPKHKGKDEWHFRRVGRKRVYKYDRIRRAKVS